MRSSISTAESSPDGSSMRAENSDATAVWLSRSNAPRTQPKSARSTTTTPMELSGLNLFSDQHRSLTTGRPELARPARLQGEHRLRAQIVRRARRIQPVEYLQKRRHLSLPGPHLHRVPASVSGAMRPSASRCRQHSDRDANSATRAYFPAVMSGDPRVSPFALNPPPSTST